MDLAELTFYRHPISGFQALSQFGNGYGLSIVPESDGEHYEVAVLKDGSLCYTTAITHDVIRYASVDDVDSYAEMVRCL
jgi:hypothetical protein